MKSSPLLLSLIALTAALAPAALSAQTTTKLSASKANDYGIVYSLPQTVIDVTLQAKCTVSTPGEFYNYAERFLGPAVAAKAVRESSTRWTVTGAWLSAHGVPQTSGETYLMQFKSGSTPYLIVDGAGLPLALNAEYEAPEAPVVTLPEATPLTASALDGSAARYAMTEDMVQSLSVAKRAEMAAAQIMQLRQSRQDYLTGQAETMPDGNALKLILKNIDAQEEALTAMFTGTVQTATDVYRTTFTPGESDERVVIARLNPVKGFVDADDLSGAPVYLSEKVMDRGKLPLTDKGEPKKFPKGGVAYTIPGSAEVSVSYDGRTYAAERFAVAQLGVVYGLEPGYFTDRKAPGYAIFDPITGGIREMGTETTE